MANLSETARSRIYTELASATSPESAEIFMHEVLDVHWEDLATKTDLAALGGNFTGLRGEFAELKGDFADLRGEFADLKGEFAELRGEFADLKADVADLRSEMRVGFAQVNTRFAHVDSRMDIGFARLDAKLERQLRVQLVWLIATLCTLGGLIIAVH